MKHLFLAGALFFLGMVLFIPESYAYLRDPTKPPTESPEQMGGLSQDQLVLTSILYSPKRKVAIVNGQAMQIGDTIGGFKLMAIYQDHVDFQGARSGQFIVSLYNASVDLTIPG